MPHFTVIRVYTTRIAKQHDKLLISIFIIITHPNHIIKCVPSVPTYIHPYMSKMRLLLKTDDETNGLFLQWVPYILGPRPRMFQC